MVTRDDGEGGVGPVPRAEVGAGRGRGSGLALAIPGERARTNLALLYGGAGRGPLSRVVIGPPDRPWVAAPAPAPGGEVAGGLD